MSFFGIDIDSGWLLNWCLLSCCNLSDDPQSTTTPNIEEDSGSDEASKCEPEKMNLSSVSPVKRGASKEDAKRHQKPVDSTESEKVLKEVVENQLAEINNKSTAIDNASVQESKAPSLASVKGINGLEKSKGLCDKVTYQESPNIRGHSGSNDASKCEIEKMNLSSVASKATLNTSNKNTTVNFNASVKESRPQTLTSVIDNKELQKTKRLSDNIPSVDRNAQTFKSKRVNLNNKTSVKENNSQVCNENFKDPFDSTESKQVFDEQKAKISMYF